MEQLLDFWFDYTYETDPLYNRDMWWTKNEKTDKEIQLQFGALREQAIKGELNAWLDTPKGTLAYVILIDQFSRNLFRNDPQMVQNDPLALMAAKHAIAKGYDRTLSLTERVFIYMPFEHSENINDQNKSVALFEKLYEDTPDAQKGIAENFVKYAKDHRDIIQKFNRFPHRNKILNRKDTPEETEFLKTHKGY